MAQRFQKRRFGISAQIILMTFLVLVFSLAGLAYVLYTNTIGSLRTSQHDMMTNLLNYTDQSVNLAQNQISVMVLSVSANEQLWRMPDHEAEELLDSYATYYTSVGSLYLVRNDGSMVGVPKQYVRALGNFASPVIQRFLDVPAQGVVWTEPYLSPLSHWTITVGTRVLLPDGSSPGLVAMDLPLLTLAQTVLNLPDSKDAALVVFNEHDQPVIADYRSPVLHYQLSSNQLILPEAVISTLQAPGEGLRSVEIDGTDYSVLSGIPNRYGWKPVLLYSNRSLDEATRVAKNTSLWLLLGSLLFCLVLAWFFARHFAFPLERLAAEMNRVGIGQLEGVTLPERDDEIGDLARSFDRMMGRIRDLVSDLQVSEDRKREAEIRSLQSQIRPHFLYNTLSAVGHMAALGRTSEVYRLIKSLTNLLSFTFDRVGDRVSLADEIGNLENYIQLQRLRYGDIFDVVYDVDPNTGRMEVLKLTLQPIVENAIFHGLVRREKGGQLIIRAQLEGERLVLEVIDNGPGISPERLRELEQTAPRGGFGHVGLHNVRERLQLNYGGKAGLEILSQTAENGSGQGTRIRITLPAVLSSINGQPGESRHS